MTSMRDIKHRIANVASTGQIIKAMDMIASTKVYKSRAMLEGARPIYQELKRVTEEIGRQEDAGRNLFYEERKIKNSLYIILTGDRGFSGGYNVNICAKALEHMEGKQEKILVMGAKGYEYFKGRNKNIVRSVTSVPDSQVYYGAETLAKWLGELYLSGQADEVFIAFTEFDNILNHIPRIEKLLPLTFLPETGYQTDKKYEPDIQTYIDNIIPLYMHMNLFRAFLESHTSEQAARMVNMDAAGKNANEMIDELTRMYNRKRQTAITQELSEIVGSANTMNKGRGT